MLVPHPGIEQYEKAGGEGRREDEMVEWHHQLDELEFEQALGWSFLECPLSCYFSKFYPSLKAQWKSHIPGKASSRLPISHSLQNVQSTYYLCQ